MRPGTFAGGSVTSAQANTPAVDQWYAACSRAGGQTYPYKGSYGSQTCNGIDYAGVNATYPVGQFTGCVGGYDGIFDMSGNVAEWEDQCGGNSPTDECAQRGGSLLSLMDDLTCAAPLFAPRMTHDYTVGFRCCKD